MKKKGASTPANRQGAEDTFDTTPQGGSRGSPQREKDLTLGPGLLRTAKVMQNEELRRSHHALEETYRKYSGLFDFAPVGYFVLDEKGVILEVNLTGSALVGEEKPRLVGDRFSRYVARDDQDAYYLHHRKMAETGTAQDTEIRLIKNGSGENPLFVMVRGMAVRDEASGIVQYRIAVLDITRREKAEEALKKAHDELEIRVERRTAELKNATETVKRERQRLYDVLETLPVYVVLLSRDYQVPFANRFFRERFGESGGRRCFEYLFQRTGPCENCESFKAFATNAPHHWEWTGPDGRNYDIYDFPFTDADGSSLIMEMGIDVTETRKARAVLERTNETLEARVAERAKDLAESESRFKAIAETTPVGIGVVSVPDGKFLYVNSAYERKYGYSEGEILNKRSPDLYWNIEDRNRMLGILKERGVVVNYEVRLKRKDGTSFWGLVSVRPITYGGKSALLGALIDITERRSSEEEIKRRAEELWAANEELERFNRAMVDRELRMITLKKQVNELCLRLGEPRQYELGFEENDDTRTLEK